MGKVKGLIDLVVGAGIAKRPLCLALVLAFIETGAALLAPLLTRDLVNGFDQDGFSWRLIGTLSLVLLVQALFGGLSLFCMGYVGHGVVANLRKKLQTHLLTLPVPFFDQHRSAELASRIVSDTSVLKDLATDQLVHLLYGLVMVTGSVFILCLLDWKMTVVLFASVIMAIVVIVPIAARLQNISKKVQDETANLNARTGQTFAEIRLVKAYAAEQVEVRSGAGSIGRLFDLNMRETRIQAVMGPIMGVALMAAMVAILGFGGARVAEGTLKIGDLIAFILYVFHIVMPMVQLTYFFSDLQKAIGASERITELFSIENEKGDEGPNPKWRGHGLVFDKVCFAYRPDGPLVLKEIDLEIRPGSVTALVGPSGSGKSTIFSLIERFYLPDKGKISLGDQTIDTFHLRAWRKGLGFVAQEAPVLYGTIRENLCFGHDRAMSDDRLWRALDSAHAREFVKALPQGLETETGERGVQLSGGQRQRLAIARAILKDPGFLMLDEATSSLDSESEQTIRSALQILMRGRTTLVIAHRLSTVVDADRIYVLERGKITGMGVHAQLLESHERYRRLVAQQFRPIHEYRER